MLQGERITKPFATRLDTTGEDMLPPPIVPFPRGFAFGHDGSDVAMGPISYLV
jgi:hypothetical protein